MQGAGQRGGGRQQGQEQEEGEEEAMGMGVGQMRQAEQVEEAANAMPNPLRPVAVSSGLRLSLLDRER